MTDRLQELRRIAEAATPGPWEVVGLDGYGGPYALRMPHRSGRTWYGVEGIKRREDAEYFVACDPDTIRALLDERDALREALEMIVKMVETDGFAWDYAMDVARAALAKARGEGASDASDA